MPRLATAKVEVQSPSHRWCPRPSLDGPMSHGGCRACLGWWNQGFSIGEFEFDHPWMGIQWEFILGGGLEHGFYDFPYIGNVIIPTDELIFFRGVGQPPTRGIYLWNNLSHEHFRRINTLNFVAATRCFGYSQGFETSKSSDVLAGFDHQNSGDIIFPTDGW